MIMNLLSVTPDRVVEISLFVYEVQKKKRSTLLSRSEDRIKVGKVNDKVKTFIIFLSS